MASRADNIASNLSFANFSKATELKNRIWFTVGALIVYLAGREAEGTTLVEARSAATITLLGIGLVILLRLTGSLPAWRWILVAAMAASIGAVLAVPALSEVFELDAPAAGVWVLMAAVVALAAVALRFVPVTADGGEIPPGPPAAPGG